MDLGFFSIDLNLVMQNLTAFINQPTNVIYGQVIALGGWLFLAYYFIFAGIKLLEKYRQNKYTKNWKWVLLAIDVPQLNVQTPMAVEQMFAQLAGALNVPNIAETYKDGFKQRWFSFEIISIEGYIQFLIWTEEGFRDLVEGAVYAQYPDAEITEVEDYTKFTPNHFPDDNHDIWASDFGLTENYGYPLRTYREFEHNISKDTVLKDPMGTFLESFSRLGPGEQMWFQILIEPINNKWKEKVIEKVKEIIGDTTGKASGGKSILDHTLDLPFKFLETVGDQVFSREAGASEKKVEKPAEPNKMRYLTPGQSKLVESMEMKINKVGFKTKLRGVYLARKEVFKKSRGVNALLGAINQFNMPNANCLARSFETTANYAFKDMVINYRKNLLIHAYKKRKIKEGGKSFVLNIEELATLWHFPMSHVKTPSVQKAGSKKSEPPSTLPVETFLPPGVVEETEKSLKEDEEKINGYSTDAGFVKGDGSTKFG